MHRLPSAETFHFYLGDPVEMLLLLEAPTTETVIYGPDLLAGQRVQFTVPGNTWMGARLAPGVSKLGYALMGTTVSPGFDFADLEMGDVDMLARQFPNADATIRRLG